MLRVAGVGLGLRVGSAETIWLPYLGTTEGLKIPGDRTGIAREKRGDLGSTEPHNAESNGQKTENDINTGLLQGFIL